MKHGISFAAGTVVAALALAGPVAAHEHPSPQSVAKHVRSADQALEMVETLVTHNQDARAAVQLARYQRQIGAAERETGAARRGAENGRERAAAARALAKVAREHDEAVETLAELVDEADGELQLDIAEVAQSELRGREKALAILTRLLERLPAAAQEGIGMAITSVSAGGSEVEELTEALESGELSSEAAAVVEGLLERARAAVERGAKRVRSIAEGRPEEARGRIPAGTPGR